MEKRLELSDMPALSPEMQKRIAVLENQLQAALTPHCAGHNIFDLEGAFEKVRTFATVFYDCYYNFYSQFPAYKPLWRKASEAFSFERVLIWIANFYAIRDHFDASRLKRIQRTISNYADGIARAEPKGAAPSPPNGKQATAYGLAGIDIASASPLLIMALAQGNPQNTTALASTEKAAVPGERAALRDAYRKTFPDAGIMDICWAAKQHYREWARWLNNELKDGSKPDRAFRRVLTSDKDAKDLRREIRPKGWK